MTHDKTQDTGSRSPLDAVMIDTKLGGQGAITLRDYLRFLHEVMEGLHEANGALQEQLNAMERSLRAYDAVISEQPEELRESVRIALDKRTWLV